MLSLPGVEWRWQRRVVAAVPSVQRAVLLPDPIIPSPPPRLNKDLKAKEAKLSDSASAVHRHPNVGIYRQVERDTKRLETEV